LPAFPPTARLRTRAEYDAVQKAGRRVPSRFVTVLGRANDLGHDRLGVIASRRVGGATRRNRAKRRIREIFRLQQSTPRRGLDFVVIARTEIAAAPFEAVQADLHSAFRRLRGSST
jgi:ribonuclease P protein component